jgi:small ligand-binding sensory domain FIST/Lon protease-like protein
LFGTAACTSRFVSAESRAECILSAASELANSVTEQLDGEKQPQLVCLFSDAQTPKSAAMLADHLRELWPGAALLGIVQPPGEDGDAPFTSILAASLSTGSSAFSFHCADPTLPPLPSVDEMLRRPGATAPQLLLLSACGFRLGPLLSVLDAAFPSRARAGGEAPPGSLLLGGGGVHSTGVVGLALSGSLLLDTVTTNGGRPVAMAPITKTVGSALIELDGRPAAAVLKDCEAQAARGPLDLGLRPTGLSGNVLGTRPSVLQVLPARQPERRPPASSTEDNSQEGSGGTADYEGNARAEIAVAPSGAAAGSAGGGWEGAGASDGAAAGGADSGVLDLSASHAELILEGSASRPGMAVLVQRDACAADEQLTLALGRYAAALPEAWFDDLHLNAAPAAREATAAAAVTAVEEAAGVRAGSGGESGAAAATNRPGRASILDGGAATAPALGPVTSHIRAGLIFSAPSRAAPSFFGVGGHDCRAVRAALELPASVPLASVLLPLQIAALPPPPPMRRVRTFAHAHSSVAVFFREDAAAHSSILVGEEPDDPSLGGALAPSTQRLLLRLAALDVEPRPPLRPSPLAGPLAAHDPTEQPPLPDTRPTSRAGGRRRFDSAITAQAALAGDAHAGAASSVHGLGALPFATLGAAVFPGTTGRFVLFEPRYRLMLRRALERGEQFATGPDPAVGTIVDIASCKELPDGRFEVVLLGLQRFRTASLSVRPASFGLHLATPIPFDDLVEHPGADARADAHDVERARAASAILFKRFTEEGLDVEEEFGPPPPEDDLPALSMWLAAAIPAEPLRKRQWLLLQDARKRLRDQRSWLQQALVAGIL